MVSDTVLFCASDLRAARVIASTSPALLLSHHHPLSIISPPRIHYLSHPAPPSIFTSTRHPSPRPQRYNLPVSLPCVEGSYWYFHYRYLVQGLSGWVCEGMSKRVSGVPEGVQELPKTRYVSIALVFYGLTLIHIDRFCGKCKKKKQICKLCIPIS